MLSDPPVGGLLKPNEASQAGLDCGKPHIALSWHRRLEHWSYSFCPFFTGSCADVCTTCKTLQDSKKSEEDPIRRRKQPRLKVCPHEHISAHRGRAGAGAVPKLVLGLFLLRPSTSTSAGVE